MNSANKNLKRRTGGRFFFALWAAKLSRALIRLSGRRGSCTPGVIAIKLCPDFLSRVGLPPKVICVTGTNGKTTTSNLLAKVFSDAGYTVTNNSAGSNIDAGVATALLADCTLSGKAKKQVAVLEVDERSSLRVYRHLTPDLLICNNIMRDSLKRNAHTDFICYILNEALPASTKVVLNADDFICSRLFPNNADRVYFGMEADAPAAEDSPLSARDVVYCPECGTRLRSEYLRFEHIGRIYCPGCGLRSPEPAYSVVSIDREKGRFTLRTPQGELSLRTVNENPVNLYNCAGAAAVLLESGISPEQLCRSFETLEIVSSRYGFRRAGRLNITNQLAKGQNPVACARAFSYVAKRPGNNKCLLVMIDDKGDNTNNSESVCWIYDTDFSALCDPSIGRIIFAGKRCRDQRLRALTAGVDPSKIFICDDLFEGAAMIDTSEYTEIYVVNDPYISDEAERIVGALVRAGEEKGDE